MIISFGFDGVALLQHFCPWFRMILEESDISGRSVFLLRSTKRWTVSPRFRQAGDISRIFFPIHIPQNFWLENLCLPKAYAQRLKNPIGFTTWAPGGRNGYCGFSLGHLAASLWCFVFLLRWVKHWGPLGRVNQGPFSATSLSEP